MKDIVGKVSDAASRLGHRVAFKVKKASPELLLVGGIACVIGGTVLACRTTHKKVDDILDEGNEKLADAKKYLTDETVALSEADEKAVRKDIAKIRVNTAGKLIRAYAPSVALGTVGIAMIFGSHGVMKKRNAVLLASYNALDAAFNRYRANVLAEEDGAERDYRYLHSDLTIDEMNELKFINRINQDAANMALDYGWYSQTSCRFDPYTSARFSMYPENNLVTIREVESCMTSRLHRNGHVFINEALHELGMDPVPWGQIYGRMWAGDQDESDMFEIIAVEDNPGVPGSPITLEFCCDGAIWSWL